MSYSLRVHSLVGMHMMYHPYENLYDMKRAPYEMKVTCYLAPATDFIFDENRTSAVCYFVLWN